MSVLRRLFMHPLFHLFCMEAVLLYAFVHTNLIPQDDNGYYQRFIETLAQGKLDFSIYGFQGASFLALPLHLLYPSAFTNAYLQVACGFLLPLAMYWAAKGFFRNTLQSVLAAYAMTMMPFFTFIGFLGFTFPACTMLCLLTIGLRMRGSGWAFLPWAFAILTKPFALALVPFFLLWHPQKHRTTWSAGWVQLGLMLILPIAYVVTQYLQLGQIVVGVHADITGSNVFQWWRFPLNAAHGVQMLFSIHNFYFPDAAKTGLGNLVHSSPLLMIFGLVSLLYPKHYWKDILLARATAVAFVIAYVLAALLDHMDHFYMEVSVLLLVFAAIPVVSQYRLLIPLVLGTLHFQFLYFFLAWQGTFFTNYAIIAIPVVVDIIALLTWTIITIPGLKGGLRGYIKTQWGGLQ